MTKDELKQYLLNKLFYPQDIQEVLDAVDAYTAASNDAKPFVSGSFPPVAELCDGLRLIEANCDPQDGRFEQIWRVAYSLLCKYDKTFRDYSGGNNR
jgi:hypothetical protein